MQTLVENAENEKPRAAGVFNGAGKLAGATGEEEIGAAEHAQGRMSAASRASVGRRGANGMKARTSGDLLRWTDGRGSIDVGSERVPRHPPIRRRLDRDAALGWNTPRALPLPDGLRRNAQGLCQAAKAYEFDGFVDHD